MLLQLAVVAMLCRCIDIDMDTTADLLAPYTAPPQMPSRTTAKAQPQFMVVSTKSCSLHGSQARRSLCSLRGSQTRRSCCMHCGRLEVSRQMPTNAAAGGR